MADGITISVTEDVTSVTVTEDVTTIDITPSVTTVEAKGISIANAGAATAMTYQGTSNTLGTGGNVAASLDHINTNGFNKNADNTIDGNTTIAAGHTVTFVSQSPVADVLDLSNNNIIRLNRLTFNDAGDGEGVIFPNWGIFESPVPLANAEGNLILAHLAASDTPIVEVKTTGIDVTGTITFDGGTTSADLNFGDNDKAVFGAGSDLEIYHDGSNSIIQESGTGDLRIRAQNLALQDNDGTNFLYGTYNGSVKLYHNNSQKFETTSAGIDVTGTVTFDGGTTSANLDFATNARARFGDGQQLQIYSDGTTSYIDENGSGNLLIRGNNLHLQKYTGANYLTAVADGATTLFHNGNTKIATTSAGIDVTGTATATTFSGDLNGTINTATTAATQSQANNSTKVATTAYVDTAVAGVVDSAPGALNTLNELAAALGDDASFSTTVTNSIGTKLPLAGGEMTGNITFSSTQTVDGRDLSADGAKLDAISTFGASLVDDADAAAARTTLGLGTAATTASTAYATSAQGSTADSALQPAGTLTGKIQTTQTANNMSGLTMNAGGTTTGGSIAFKEGTDNGTNSVTLQGPASTADVTVNLPSTAGTLQLQPSEGAFANGDKTKLDTIATSADAVGSTPTFTSLTLVDSDHWKFAVEGSNNLLISFDETNVMKIDSSGNLTVIGNVTAFGSI